MSRVAALDVMPIVMDVDLAIKEHAVSHIFIFLAYLKAESLLIFTSKDGKDC